MFFTFLAFLSFTTLDAAESDWQSGKTNKSQVRLISPYSSIGPQTSQLRLGLEFKLARGWHVYWKNPGDIGYPPKVQWSLPQAWKAAEILYPAPEKFQASSFTAYGYHDRVIYLVDLEGPPSSERFFDIGVSLDYLVCELQCIPEKAELKLSLRRSKDILSPHAQAIDQSSALIPQPLSPAVFSIVDRQSKSLRIQFAEAHRIDDVMPASRGPKTSLKTSKLGENLFEITSPLPLPNLEVVAVWKDGKTPRSGSIFLEAEGGWPLLEDFLIAIFLALLGGLILNLMPCVLPVVGLKTISLVKLGIANTKEVRRSALLTTLGILTSFLALALLVIGLRAAGTEVGWGFQFQSPGFVTFMTIVIFVFALNLFGLFEFGLGSSQTARLSGLQKGPFWDGALATLLATPCSAPFLGTALTFALAQPGWLLAVFFLAMGLGLSVPYLLLATIPQSLKIFPKPGPWMEVLRRILGYSLMLAVLWLLYVLQQQTSILFVFGFLAALLGIYALVHEWKNKRRWALVVIVALGAIVAAERDIRKSSAETARYVTFSEEALQQRLLEGEILYVVVTAEWCLTCKFNEKFIMDTSWFEELLTSRSVKVVTYDWTSRDDSIAAFLKRYDRVAIPFSMLISKDKSVVFPELLSRPNVEEHFKKFFD